MRQKNTQASLDFSAAMGETRQARGEATESLCCLVEQMQGEPAIASAGSERTPSLAERILEGDPSAEQELVTTYRRGVLVVATARTRDREAACDLTQDILVAVLQALREGKLRQPDKLAPFIYGVTRNLINNYIALRTRRAECELDDGSYTADPVEELEASERKRLVRNELAALGVVDQQILRLSLVDGQSLAEVAKRLNMSHEAVRARKSRAIRKMTKKFTRRSQRRGFHATNCLGALWSVRSLTKGESLRSI